MTIGAAISAVLTAGMLPSGGAADAADAPRQAGAATKVTRDFNGDGYQDLAVGAPNGSVGGKTGAGYVAVVYGSGSGPDLSRSQIISQDSPGMPDPAEPGAGFGTSIAAGDLNGDGYADLAIGSPSYGPYDDGVHHHGAVTVLFGGATGLGDPASVSGSYRLGGAVGMGDVNGDGRPELIATEAPSNFGDLYLYDVAEGAYTLNPLPYGVRRLGLTGITTGDVNGDGYSDVVTSYPAVGGTPLLSLYLGSAAGLSTEAAATISYADTAALGDIDHDGRADLVTGYFGQSAAPAGLSVRYGTRQGLPDEPDRVITQDTPGVPGTTGDGDQFGSAVAVGDANGDGYADVAVGAQGKPVAGADRAGSVVLLKGARRGLTTKGAQAFSQDTPGVPDAAEQDDLFGWAVSLIDVNGDRRADLTVGAVGEDKRNPGTLYRGDGAVTVLPGAPSGATGTGAVTFGPADLGADPTDAGLGWSLIP